MSPALPRLWLTWVLLGLNVAAFAATVAVTGQLVNVDAQRLFDLGGNFGRDTLDGDFWRLGSSMFLHGGLLHLTMNMLALHAGGRQIEIVYGRSGMLAIYGLFGAFGGFLLRHRGKLAPGAAEAALRNIGMVIAINLMITFSVKGIDMAAHLGGLVGGFATGWALEALPRTWSMARRALVIGTFGAAVLSGATFVVPAGGPDLPVVVEGLEQARKQCFTRYNELVVKIQAGTIDRVQFADAIERDVLGVWRAARRELEDGGLDERYSEIRRLAQVREDALIGMVAALRADDDAAFARHKQRFEDPRE